MALNSLGLGFVFTARDLASGVMGRVSKTFNKTASQAERNSKIMGAAFAGIGVGIAGITAGLVGIGVGVAAANQFSEFGQTMAGVGAVMKATRAEMALLEEAAIDAGLATQFSPKEAAEGLQNLATAGLNARDATTALIPVLDLATGSLGQLGVGEAASAVVGTLNSYSLGAENATNVTDRLLRITQLTNFQTSDFAAGLAKAAAAGGQFGQSLNDVLITMGLLRNRNIDASSSSTAVRESLRRIGSDKNAQSALKEAGVSAFDAAGNMRPFVETALDLANATAEMSDEERNAIVVRAFGARGLLAFNAVAKAQTTVMRDGEKVTLKGAEAIAHLRQELENAGGTADEFRGKLLETFAGQKQLLGGVLQTFGTVMGEGFSEVFKPFVSIFVQGLTAVTKALSTLPKGVKTGIAAIFVAISSFVAGGGAVVLFGAAVTLLLPAIKIIGISFLVLGTIMAPIIVGFGILTAAVVGLKQAIDQNIGGIGDKFSEVFNKIKLAVKGLSQLISEGQITGELAEEFQKAENGPILDFITRIFGMVERTRELFHGISVGFSEGMKEAQPAIDAFMLAIDQIGEAFNALGADAGENASNEFDKAALKGQKIGTMLAKAAEIGIKVFTVVLGLVRRGIEAWSDFQAGIGPIAGIFEMIKGAVEDFATSLDATLGPSNEIGSNFSKAERAASAIGTAFEVVGKIIAFVIATVINQFQFVFNIIAAVVKGVVGLFAGLRDFFVGIFTGDMTLAVNGLKRILFTLAEFMINVVGAALEFLLGAVDAIITATTDKPSDLAKSFAEGRKELIGDISSGLDIVGVTPEVREEEKTPIPEFAPIDFPQPGPGAEAGAQPFVSAAIPQRAPDDIERAAAQAAIQAAKNQKPPQITVLPTLSLDGEVLRDAITVEDTRSFTPGTSPQT